MGDNDIQELNKQAEEFHVLPALVKARQFATGGEYKPAIAWALIAQVEAMTSVETQEVSVEPELREIMGILQRGQMNDGMYRTKDVARTLLREYTIRRKNG